MITIEISDSVDRSPVGSLRAKSDSVQLADADPDDELHSNIYIVRQNPFLSPSKS